MFRHSRLLAPTVNLIKVACKSFNLFTTLFLALEESSLLFSKMYLYNVHVYGIFF